MFLPLLTDNDVYRILQDILRAELKRIRGSLAGESVFPVNAVFSDAPWNVDSIEIMEMAGAVNEFFQLYKTGIEDNLLRYKSMEKWIEAVSLSLHEHHDEITFRTSGSTGSPLPFTHTMEALIQETVEIAKIFKHGNRIISFVPAHHIYGFIFTVLLPAHAGIRVVDARDTGIGSLINKLESGDLLVSFPAHWSYMERSVPCWPENIRGISSTGPASPELLRRLCKKGLDCITEIYGSSEYGSIGFRSSPDNPYSIFSFLQRSKHTENGEYFFIRTLPQGDKKKFYSDDLIKWENDKEFYVRQRRDGAVQVGGINVYPGKVADKIKEHPAVADCAVRLADKSENPRLKAFIVPAHGVDPDLISRKIKAWIYKNLSVHERPVNLSFGREIPKNDMGKNMDWEIE